MTLGSLFDGIGGFPLAASRNGIEPIWASEIEPFCVEVTREHFPKMKHLGDITKINGAEIEPVDIISFGSPCQDLSIAGRRDGLKGERSGLFHEAVRIIYEMREATDGQYPTYAIWENVPGVFTSNGGRDFRAVLGELTKSEIPMPNSGGWANAGVVRGGGITIFWRILDAQYWGVPQRRKRIFLVANFGNKGGWKVLFKPKGVCGCVEESKANGERTAEDTARSVGGGVVAFGISSKSSNAMKSSNPHSGIYSAESSRTLDQTCCNPVCNQGGIAVVDIFTDKGLTVDLGGQGSRIQANAQKARTLSANGGGGGAKTGLYCLPRDMTSGKKDTYAVRRLTPTECERLQGFPDGWTDMGSDTARYKALGNSVAVPCVEFIMEGIKNDHAR